MMQFSENAAPPPMHPNALGLCLDLPPPSDTILKAAISSWPAPKSSATSAAGNNYIRTTAPSTSSTSTSSSLMSSASCMEQLLVHCAQAVERGDATLAHQILWVLNTVAPPDGDSTQRLASAFLRALVIRAGSPVLLLLPSLSLSLHRFSPLDLASFVDITPYHRFGFSASNSAIASASDPFPSLHLVDLSPTHCMQIPTLIDLLASRRSPEPPLLLRLTLPVPHSTLIPPLLDDDGTGDDYCSSFHRLIGSRLVAFARSRNIPMDFTLVPSDPSDGFQSLIDHLTLHRAGSEALVVNCQNMLRYVPDGTPRSMLLKNLRGLEPNLVTVVEEDVELTGEDVVERVRAAFNYLWIPYDAVDSCLPEGSERRRWYEAEVRWKIENVVACEGAARVERAEGRASWAARMRGAGFRPVGFGDEAAAEVRGLLDEHAAGWGLKKEEDLDLVLTWKGHNVVFASAWVPS